MNTKKKTANKINPKDFFNLKPILDAAPDAQYYVIFGEKSNGKTFAVKEYGLKKFIETGEQTAIIRRYREDFVGSNGNLFYDDMVNNIYKGNLIEKYTKGKYNNVQRFRSAWYLIHKNENGETDLKCAKPFAVGFALSTYEHTNTNAFPGIKTILFDEFISREGYLGSEFNDEFTIFLTLLSNIIRAKDDVRIFMCGNTINRYCIYFDDMGLKNIKNMKKGDIDVYKVGEDGPKIAVQYSDFKGKGKPSDIYFAFDNPKTRMITQGEWQFDVYPKLPFKYDRKEVKYIFFINFDRELFQCELIYHDKSYCIFCHVKTTLLKLENKNLVYDLTPHSEYNYRTRLTRPASNLERLIAELFRQEKVFYQNNAVGDSIRNYLNECSK